MNSPCEILVEAPQHIQIKKLLEPIAYEAWRIECKYSRYRSDNIIHDINHHKKTPLDAESHALFDFANTCFEISDGLFDITSGVLRKVWQFKTLKTLPKQADIDALLPFIGWQKVDLTSDYIQLPKGMQVDLGGIGKEYAVDCCVQMLMQRFAAKKTSYPFLINFGGDLRVNGPRNNDQAWKTGIEHSNVKSTHSQPSGIIHLKQGAITTSGTARQHITINNKRYGHILNPKTGWPVHNPPKSITIAASTCIEAGLLSTLAMLHGEKAENFLDSQDSHHWISR